jgi:hypothetical protein
MRLNSLCCITDGSEWTSVTSMQQDAEIKYYNDYIWVFRCCKALEVKYLGALYFCIVKKLKASDTVYINEGIKCNYVECITIYLPYILKSL